MNDYTNDPMYTDALKRRAELEMKVAMAQAMEDSWRRQRELLEAQLAAAEATIDNFEDAAFDAEFPAIRRAIASMQTA